MMCFKTRVVCAAQPEHFQGKYIHKYLCAPKCGATPERCSVSGFRPAWERWDVDRRSPSRTELGDPRPVVQTFRNIAGSIWRIYDPAP